MSVENKFQKAVALHQQGRGAEAALLYEEILGAEPRHFAALYHLGILVSQGGNFDAAAALLSRAIEENPDRPEPYFSLGYALQALGRLDAALAAYDKAIGLRSNYADAYSNRGNIFYDRKRFDDALASFTKAIEYKPNLAEAWFNRGNTLTDLKRFPEAVTDYARAIAIKPGFARAHYGLGNAHWLLKHPREALESYSKAIELAPDFAEAWFNRGSVLLEIMRLQEALADFDRAIALDPSHADAWSNRGAVLQYLNAFDQALASYDRTIELMPANAKAWSNRGVSLRNLRRFDQALASYDKAIELEPEFAEAHVNKSATELVTGNWQAGWRNFEWRRKIAEATVYRRKFSQPRLAALADVPGKTILVYWEEDGFGDTIQFCRYLPLLHQMGAKVLFSAQKKLHRLIGSLADVQLVDADDASLIFDYHIPLMSLPLVFETRIETVPARTPYLFADGDLVRSWRERLGSSGFKIGICWQGNSSHQKVDLRCFSPAHFEKLVQSGGIRLISLQKGDGEKQLDALPPGMTVERFELDAGPDAFADTAAIMMGLDLVITADTSIAHLAGALGAPAWVALHHKPDWRWLLDRPDSPWYPTVKLFRQKTDGDWPRLFDDITAALAGLRET